MKVSEYVECDATALGELIRAGQITSAEVVDAARLAIDAVEPRLNAIACGPFDDVPAPRDGPFSGVPIVVKDTLFEAGRPFTLGSRLLDGFVAPGDSAPASRLRDAGFVTLGRTATPEFAFNFDTAPVTNGRTCNPWAPELSPGGSSGGSAALVAARAVPLAHGSDGGGSIRVPAAWCGLVGLKPTRGRVPAGPFLAELAAGLGHEFGLTRTMRDTAALLDVLAGPLAGDRYYVDRPARPFIEELGADPGRLRIAVHTTSFWGKDVDPEIVGAVEAVGSELERLGHHMQRDVAPVDVEAIRTAHIILWTWAISGTASGLGGLVGREGTGDTLEQATLACARYGASLTADDIGTAFGIVNSVSRAWGSFLDDYDVFLSPTTPTGPLPSGALDQNDRKYTTAESWIDEIFAWAPFTPIANLTGQPSISLPLGRRVDGRPIGVMFTAQSLRDDLLIRLGTQLEAAMPWAHRRPSVTP